MGFILFSLFCVGVFYIIRFVMKEHKKAKEKIRTVNLDLYFIKASEFRKKDDEILKGSCKFDFQEEQFTIIQNEKKIENNVDSIYKFRFWEHEGYTYFAVNMRSKIEYMFSLKLLFEKTVLTCLAENHNILVENE